MNRGLMISATLLCVVLLTIDIGTFAIPVAFILCVGSLWNRVFTMIQTQLNDYRQDIEKKIADGEQAVLDSQDFLESVEKTEKDLLKTMNSILQTAHQEAAFLLKKSQNEVDSLKENQRRQIDLQAHILRQKWRLAMGQEWIAAVQDYIASSATALPDSGAVLDSVSKKSCYAIRHGHSLPKSGPESL